MNLAYEGTILTNRCGSEQQEKERWKFFWKSKQYGLQSKTSSHVSEVEGRENLNSMKLLGSPH